MIFSLSEMDHFLDAPISHFILFGRITATRPSPLFIVTIALYRHCGINIISLGHDGNYTTRHDDFAYADHVL
jgi:hypothetical protein